MAKQPKPEDNKADTTTVPVAQTGQTLSVSETKGAGEQTGGGALSSDAAKEKAEPQDGMKLSDAVRAAVEAGKSPDKQIMVVGPKGGRWRAGRHFGPEPTIIDVAELTEDEAMALISDPKLVVGPAFPNVPS